MTNPDPKQPGQRDESLGATLFVLGFGLFTLAFLIVIDHPDWFHIRPVSNVAKALSLAADAPDNAAERLF